MLKVKICSFSYKKSGIPKDTTPNGGGFVFDCRFIINPGRIEEFMPLTGKDKEVIDFLDNNEQMQNFLSKSAEIIKSAVDNYITRDFTDLIVCFGCTGGQHRSVYAAEELGALLKETYRDKIAVEIHHTDLPAH
jgi:RNase adaptor protein for sRNA GlmZ degradation